MNQRGYKKPQGNNNLEAASEVNHDHDRLALCVISSCISCLMVPGVHYIIRLIYCTIGRCEDCARNEASLALTLYERVAVGRKNLCRSPL